MGVRASRAVLLIAFMVVPAVLANAQFRASLRGTITDAQGAGLTNSTITLTNTANNQEMIVTSDANGVYEFDALAPGPYSVSVEHDGFKKKVLDNIEIIPEQLNSLDIQLELNEAQQITAWVWLRH